MNSLATNINNLNNKQKVAIYARVSTAEQAEKGYSIDAQIETLKNYCISQNKEIYDIYVDRGISGKSMKGRLALQKLLKDAEKGLFDTLMVWKINRLARKQLDMLKIVDKLNTNGIAFRSFSENFETETPMGKFALQMMGAVSELERNTIVDNVKMGMKQRARQGKWNGGVVLGYETVKTSATNKHNEETKLQIVPDEAIIVKKIFNLYASGHGFKSIANKLNHEGYRTKYGNMFSNSAIREIIKNPIYIGKIRFNLRENWSEKRRAGTNPNPIISDGDHEAIISQEVWDKVHALYDKKQKIYQKRYSIDFPLTGLLRCPECGHSMVMNRATWKLKDGTKRFAHYYICSQNRTKGAAACHANGIRKEKAEKEVFNRLSRTLANKKLIKDIVKRINEKRASRTEPLEEELHQLEKRIEKVAEKKDKYFNLFEENIIDNSVLAEKLNEITDELENLDSRKAEIKSELSDSSTAPVTYDLVEKKP